MVDLLTHRVHEESGPICDVFRPSYRPFQRLRLAGFPERASLSTQNVLPTEGISVSKAGCRDDLAPQAGHAASLALVSSCGGVQLGHFGWCLPQVPLLASLHGTRVGFKILHLDSVHRTSSRPDFPPVPSPRPQAHKTAEAFCSELPLRCHAS